MPTETAIQKLTHRRDAIAGRLRELSNTAFHVHREDEHRSAIAAARASALIGDDEPLKAAQAAQAESLAMVKKQASAKLAAENEASELTAELNAVAELLAAEETALAHRRRAFARERFDALASDYSAHITAAAALLPGLVAAGEHAFTGSTIHRLASEFAVPDFALVEDDTHDHRVVNVPMVTAPDLNSATTEFNQTIEAVE